MWLLQSSACFIWSNGFLDLQVRAFAFANGGLVAAQRLHERLLNAVVAAPIAFFDAVSAGRVLNRFASDTATADDSLPFILNLAAANAFALGGVAVVLAYSQPLVAAVFIPIALFYCWLQVGLLQSLRAKLDSESIVSTACTSLLLPPGAWANDPTDKCVKADAVTDTTMLGMLYASAVSWGLLYTLMGLKWLICSDTSCRTRA